VPHGIHGGRDACKYMYILHYVRGQAAKAAAMKAVGLTHEPLSTLVCFHIEVC
jgi:hypothetical protein